MLNLDTGLRVRLTEIEAPAPGYDGRQDEPYAKEARGVLEAAALGREARLWYGGLTRDDYGRALAHVLARDEVGGNLWLNGLMVRQGAARVRTWPDNARRAARLLALEQEARGEKRGLWALDHWRVRGLDDLEAAPTFSLVEGRLASLASTPGDGMAHLLPEGIKFDVGERLGGGPAFEAGARLRLRGRIDTRDESPRIRVTHWAQVELVQAGA